MRSVLVALLVTIGITAARADIVYSVYFHQASMGGFVNATLTGTIVTDGAIGVITPNDIVSWQFTDHDDYGMQQPIVTYTAGLPDMPSWTEGSMYATQSSLTFDFGPQFSNYALFSYLLNFSPGACGQSHCGNRSVGATHQYEDREFVPIATGGSEIASPVPAPILGAGLPGLMLLGLLGWWRRKPNRHRCVARRSR